MAVSGRASRRSQRGVALVVTLIMLAVITFMAVTFLVLSQRERSAVTGTTDTKIARNASDTAFTRVCTELLTRIMMQTNFQDFNLIVSTNYINYQGLFDGTPGTLSPTNVNYDYLVGPSRPPITSAQDRNINIASLMFNPRVPVFPVTNAGTGASEFRYYLDLNRNGRDDVNGTWPVIVLNSAGAPSYLATNASGQISYLATNILSAPAGLTIVSNTMIGDPEWIGILERPTELHSADNRFIARYAYVVVPAGKTLDINTVHNEALTRSVLASSPDGYLRNQGVGPWEINLAAFLVDLNTNIWDLNPNFPNLYYQYNEGLPTSPLFGPNRGLAFDDARSILRYRYANNYLTLSSANANFPLGRFPLQNGIDYYSDGPRMLTTSTNEGTQFPDNAAAPWAGSYNTNHYFSHQDYFDQSKTEIGIPLPPGFSDRLRMAGTSNDTYNAYTFYRMLAQMGTDSTADQGKINVNYKNTDNAGNVIPGLETNLNSWTTPLDFFTNAANAMFRQMQLYDFNSNLICITNIPVYEDPVVHNGTNIDYYTPAVHRVLQLAANMYDAINTRYINGGPTNYPTVFRPIFNSQNGIVSIVGYQEVTDINPALNFQYQDAQTVAANPGPYAGINIYGVPWVIGAKKGFPNFNEFTMDNPLTVSRDLQFTNLLGQANPPWNTNQIFNLSITNAFGLEAWNSYTNYYGRPLRLIASNQLTIIITNEFNTSLLQVTNLAFGIDTNWSTGWPGWTENKSDSSFMVPLFVSNNYTNGIYRQNGTFVPLAPPTWDATFQPHLWMSLQFKLQFILIDTSVNRVIDFVNLTTTQPTVDIPAMLDNNANSFEVATDPDAPWDTNFLNRVSGPLKGVYTQIQIGGGMVTVPDYIDTTGQSSVFYDRLNGNQNDTNFFQCPYAPHRVIHQTISWAANDPLVHYTIPDLTSTNGAEAQYNIVTIFPTKPAFTNIGALNFSYQPWGGYHLPGGGSLSGNANPFDFDLRVKDPGLQKSDDWDFPTNKLPNIGWLGRIHRGTPWQTVFLKPSNQTPDNWRQWSSDFITNDVALPFGDAYLTLPTQDYGLFDLFTTSINDNAARGRLNVNQTNLADWSAVLSGVSVLTNSINGVVGPSIVNPAGPFDPTNPTPVAYIWEGINAARANTNPTNGTVFPNQTFQHAGDVLSAPQLSVASPYLYTVGLTNNNPAANGITDEIMERIPQQIMSLLTLNQAPRFVIYSFGQTLRPADHSLVVGGTFNGLCTNYQITAESATRAVVHVEGTPDSRYVNGKVDPQGRSYPPHIVVEQYNVLGPD